MSKLLISKTGLTCIFHQGGRQNEFIISIQGFAGYYCGFLIYSLSYPVLRSIWLHISANPSQTIAVAMLFRTIYQTASPATAQTPDPW